MGYNPFLVVALATWAELSSEKAQEFFKDTALQHTGLLVFCVFGIPTILFEAGQNVRTLVNGWHTTEVVGESGVIDVASEQNLTPPLATTEAATNQETKIKENYEDVIQDSASDFSGSRQDNCQHDSERLELVFEPSSSQLSTQTQEVTHSGPNFIIASRESNAFTSGDSGEADNPKTKGRVPRSRHKVFAQRYKAPFAVPVSDSIILIREE